MTQQDTDLLNADTETVTDTKEVDTSTLMSNATPTTSDGEDMGINSALQIKTKITVTPGTIKVDDIVTSNFKKISREKSLIGLSGVVGEWGVVTPIHVMTLEGGDLYMLFDGLRRTFAALRAGKTEIPAMIWDFEDKQEGKEKANLLGLMINRSQQYKNKEVWEQMQILEEVNGANPGLIEYLLQMNSGDAMKMKDIMLSDAEYFEIRDDLMEGVTTIDQAYKKLTNERRKENRLAKEDSFALEGSDTPLDLDNISDEQHLSVDAVKDILELADRDITDELMEEINEMEGDGGDEPFVQDRSKGDRIDPELRQSILVRDEFTCQCCGLGGKNRLSTLAVHHCIEVQSGGPDTPENLVTCCLSCHNLIHCIAWGRVTIDLNGLDEQETSTFRKIFKYANIIIETDKRTGRTKEQIKESAQSSTRHPFPGEGLKDNNLAYKNAQKAKEVSLG